ncbi:Mad3_BUB1_I domain-containing protein, partial [Cephalotus follicularis]
MDDNTNNNLFTSLISDIKSYTGKDPLLPWLRGIKKLKGSLTIETLNEKLPRFLQKCTQEFEADRRYRNDLRYVRVWLQLMDFVDDPKALLRTMEVNRIGMMKSLFYQAYALYYEKQKKFEEAEKMYHLGVQNLAEPLDELQKSYEQFLHRMQRHNKKRIQEGKTAKRPLSARNIPLKCSETEENENICRADYGQSRTWIKGSLSETLPANKFVEGKKTLEKSSQMKKALLKSEHVGISEKKSEEPRIFGSDDTVVVKFVDTAIVGKSEAEDACHHGLVEPTVNTKEAMNAINSMFQEPLDTAPVRRRSHKIQQKKNYNLNNGFEVFIDENLDNGIYASIRKEKDTSLMQHSEVQACQHPQEPFVIFVDDEESNQNEENPKKKDNLEHCEVQFVSASRVDAFVFPGPKDLSSESSDDRDADTSPRAKFREDTVVNRFVGSTILDEPEVENVCHHGLVDPTINLKEAMDDINNMFGKPIDFVRAKKSKKQGKTPHKKEDLGGFSILPDDDLEHQRNQPPAKSISKSIESDFFEPTAFTKEATDEINKMFGMPMDF